MRGQLFLVSGCGCEFPLPPLHHCSITHNQQPATRSPLFELSTVFDSMEVVGAVASFIALAQGLEAGVRMVGFFKSIPEIQQDYEALRKEVGGLSRITLLRHGNVTLMTAYIDF